MSLLNNILTDVGWRTSQPMRYRFFCFLALYKLNCFHRRRVFLFIITPSWNFRARHFQNFLVGTAIYMAIWAMFNTSEYYDWETSPPYRFVTSVPALCFTIFPEILKITYLSRYFGLNRRLFFRWRNLLAFWSQAFPDLRFQYLPFYIRCNIIISPGDYLRRFFPQFRETYIP